MTLVRSLLDFWFGAPGSPEFGATREVWFRKDPAFDAAIRRHFEDELARAREGAHDRLIADPEGALALTILLDQFSRNLYRGQAKAFAADTKARWVAEQALARGFDERLLPVQRQFFYLPFQHSEMPADQDRSVALYRKLAEADPRLASTVDYAIRHRGIIERFGRFPHRNAALGRETTEAEANFLAEPGSSF
ncbi:MAG: DUF924 domain-containing protein [Proteobacteria bacterium]|nr:DUF924 domain-containing protein [Pseudomonadota bacterium]MBI3498596.1 DUF924 domain-containing protein [Pseudomonadota bacterium]